MVSANERFLFELNGLVVVRGVFAPEELKPVHTAIDAHLGEVTAREDASVRNATASGAFGGTGPRKDLGGILRWEETSFFRELLAHPKLVPYLNEFLGKGYRLDHQPQLIIQDRNGEGFDLHGGPMERTGQDDGRGLDLGAPSPVLQYRCMNGNIWNSLIAMSVALVDSAAGDGGFCAVRGSHKLTLPMPNSIASGHDKETLNEHLWQPVLKAGDVIFFSEATIHGALPWNAEHQRRIALYRFSPHNFGYGRAYTNAFGLSEEDKARFTAEQLSVLEAPYANRLERKTLAVDEGERGVKNEAYQRSQAKKDLDMKLFGTQYF